MRSSGDTSSKDAFSESSSSIFSVFRLSSRVQVLFIAIIVAVPTSSAKDSYLGSSPKWRMIVLFRRTRSRERSFS